MPETPVFLRRKFYFFRLLPVFRAVVAPFTVCWEAYFRHTKFRLCHRDCTRYNTTFPIPILLPTQKVGCIGVWCFFWGVVLLFPASAGISDNSALGRCLRARIQKGVSDLASISAIASPRRQHPSPRPDTKSLPDYWQVVFEHR